MVKSNTISRRNFIKGSAGAVGVLGMTGLSWGEDKPKRTATDPVVLGKSGVVVSRLAMGTGTHNGQIQHDLGQEKFNKLVLYANERGITFFETAENYGGMHEMLGKAVKLLDRDKIQLQTKIPWWKQPDPVKTLDRYRKELNTDYFDTLLIHCVTTAEWAEEQKHLMEFLENAKEKGLVRAPGVSIHGRYPLDATADLAWGDVRMVRINHNGNTMDKFNREGEVDVNACVAEIKKMHDAGKGIIGMKLIGNGTFKDPEVRKQSIKFVMGLDCVDCVSIGFKSPQEIDEAMDNMNRYLNI